MFSRAAQSLPAGRRGNPARCHGPQVPPQPPRTEAGLFHGNGGHSRCQVMSQSGMDSRAGQLYILHNHCTPIIPVANNTIALSSTTLNSHVNTCMHTYIHKRTRAHTGTDTIHYRSADGVNDAVGVPHEALLAAHVQAQHLASHSNHTLSATRLMPPPQMPPRWGTPVR